MRRMYKKYQHLARWDIIFGRKKVRLKYHFFKLTCRVSTTTLKLLSLSAIDVHKLLINLLILRKLVI